MFSSKDTIELVIAIETQLAEYIRSGDVNSYAKIRYPSIPEGESLIFTGEDFSNVNFLEFSIGFMVFKNCVLDGAILRGQPVTIIDSSIKNLNVAGFSVVINAHNSDFRGMKYDEATLLGKKENGSAGCSHFYNCIFDTTTKIHFLDQGVAFH